MKGKIKILSLLMAAAMVSSMFVACSDNGGTSSTSSTDNNNASTGSTPAANKEVVELTWWHWGDAPKNGDAAIEALNKKSAEDIGVKINFIWATGDDQKLKTALSTGQADDIAFTCSWFANYVTAAQKGQLMDITDMVQTDCPELYSFVPEYVWKGSQVNGKLYGIPTYKDSAAAQYWSCNKEYVIDGAKAGDEFFATTEKVASVTPVLKKVKEYADAGNPYPHDLTAPFNYNQAGLNGHGTMFESIKDEIRLGVKLGDENYKVISYYEDPDYLADLKTLQEWYKAGYVNADCEQLEKEPEFLIVGSAQGWKGAEKSTWGLNKDYTVEINKKCGPYATTNAIIGSLNGIFANSKHPHEALKYLNYANMNVDYRNMLAYGVKDVNWKDNGDGTVTSLNDDFSPGKFAQATFFTMIPAAPAPADMYSAMKTEMDAAVPTKLLGFTANIDPVKNELAACTNVIEKYYRSIQCGTVKDLDATISKMMTELNAAGYDKIKTEFQSQVDAFLGK